jgi:hypothetical protein
MAIDAARHLFAPADADTERTRRRVQLMVQITSRVGKYRGGLAQAASRLTPAEAAIMADLERNGLDVSQLREVLCGAHVLVDDPDLYARWRFPQDRERLSSHHRNIDKRTYPDIGLKGPLVREKLHGRTTAGTWMQLEKTPASMGPGIRLPSVTDLKHLLDYVVYRLTKSNVGPWGLSKNTERRPMYLSPSLSTSVPLPRQAEDELTAALVRIEADDDVTSASPDLAVRFPPPVRAHTLAELVFVPGTRNGRGLFGASNVYVTEAPSSIARSALTDDAAVRRWSLPDVTHPVPSAARVGERGIRYAARRVPVAEQKERS